MSSYIKKGDILLKKHNLIRANNRCELCGATFELDNHHLLPKSVYPQWRFEKRNTVILCRRKCHNLAENFPIEFARIFKEKVRFKERVKWVEEHAGIGKYPTEVNWEEMFDNLMSEK